MFEGFSPETIDFLWGIRMNNNREWFLAHKTQYQQTLYEPMKALGQELFRPFADRPGDILKVSRIYRDARMHHPLPYKESLWCCIRQDGAYWMERPCLFLEITPEGVEYGFLLWKPTASYLEEFRKAITARLDEFLTLVQQTESAVGIPIVAETYKKPKPCDNPMLEPYFAWKSGILCVKQVPVGPEMFGPDLAVQAQQMLTALIPLYDYFCRF